MITILDIAFHINPSLKEKESVNMGDIDALRLPFFAGCRDCAESLACYNSIPCTDGWVRCKACAEGSGLAYQDAETFVAKEFDPTACERGPSGDEDDIVPENACPACGYTDCRCFCRACGKDLPDGGAFCETCARQDFYSNPEE